jgi:hypothetical protein
VQLDGTGKRGQGRVLVIVAPTEHRSWMRPQAAVSRNFPATLCRAYASARFLCALCSKQRNHRYMTQMFAPRRRQASVVPT